MTVSKISNKCSKCNYKNTCNNKRMELSAEMKYKNTVSADTQHPTVDINNFNSLLEDSIKNTFKVGGKCGRR